MDPCKVLPTEVLSCIVQCLRPSDSPVAIPAIHEVTKALTSLTLVSSTLRSLAIPYLYTYCLYIDGPLRLQLLLRTLSSKVDTGSDKEHQTSENARKTSTAFSLQGKSWMLKSLYLAPFTGDTIEEPAVAKMIDSLFELLSPSLARLVIDMPLRSLYPEEDIDNIRPILRAAFARLEALEEFTSAQDELYLETRVSDDDEPLREIPLWSTWHRLKHLALYNVDIEEPGFLRGLRKLQNLEVLVLTRADGEHDWSTSALLALEPLKRVTIVNSASGHLCGPVIIGVPDKPSVRGNCDTKIADIVRLEVLVDGDGQEGAEDIEVCQTWTRDRAIEGTLWDAV